MPQQNVPLFGLSVGAVPHQTPLPLYVVQISHSSKIHAFKVQLREEREPFTTISLYILNGFPLIPPVMIIKLALNQSVWLIRVMLWS